MLRMLRLILCVFMISASAFAQAPPEKVKKEIDSLQAAVTDVVSATVPGFGVLQRAKGTYLDGYGVVVTLEVAFEQPRNPFTPGTSANDVRTVVNQRRKDTVEKLTNLLKQRVPVMDSISPSESATIIVYLLNTNPADLPDLPSQIVFTLKKQDVPAGRVSLKDYK
jgi:hypothetical protein